MPAPPMTVQLAIGGAFLILVVLILWTGRDRDEE
jgi:hypothetical protein